ncbi:serine hydrolase domain-containing protein [Streptomyces sp. SP18CS02]|uniref:serine hydrolase domain-containing protein n=1 Tax=Streptomyces sp. SP18CS02 TaxID=3002531 RepID=UPI002E790E52|nr:serine hydrolase domain-containing protein [Streptomyces sp. SP18CS02]MEE1752615.1 serine hydrolase [Streptomyces sp. SP18CS02]
MLAVPTAGAGAHGATVPEPSPSVSAPPSADSAFPPLGQAVTARLDAAIQAVMRETRVPGVVVGLSAPGKGEYVRAFGVADKATGAPMKTDMNFRIGSETKTFTVTALLELVDRKKVGLDDPISKYVDGVPNGDRITLRDLAGMRSGLFNYSEDEGFVEALTADPRRPYSPRELLDYSFKHPIQFQPGERFEYSNTNLILVGLVVEKAGGQPLHEFIEQNVTEPAGLRHTVFPTDAAFPDPHPQGYTDQLETASGGIRNATDWNPSWGWAAGAMISDLTDLRSWARTVATGTLLTPQTQAERLKTGSTPITGVGYGLGIFDVQGWIGHNGSLPGYESLTIYLPEARATLVVLLNTDSTVGQVEPSTLFGQAITRIVTPGHVYNLPVPVSSSPEASRSPSSPSTSRSPASPTTGESPSSPVAGESPTS